MSGTRGLAFSCPTGPSCSLINSLGWRDNVLAVAPASTAWYDNFYPPDGLLCINRRLYTIASCQIRRTFLAKLAIGLGILFAQIPLRHRYDIENVPTYPLVYRGPNIIGLISATYYIYILRVYAPPALAHYPALVLRTLPFRAPPRTSIGWSRSRRCYGASLRRYGRAEPLSKRRLASFALYCSAAEAQKHYRIALWPVASRCRMKQPADSTRAVEGHGPDSLPPSLADTFTDYGTDTEREDYVLLKPSSGPMPPEYLHHVELGTYSPSRPSHPSTWLSLPRPAAP
ncbi:hypothetical protein B0H17DRAFT_1216626 [Mycena rosella]|uniref:Uncharacterized protein n=1 Tax=Mycena rosella TaxID=1033263 RepID=A0AAD7C6P5_MYCRO|nr:hypothetical protein B0H17DRAFT_1216626 [Mycena rosella]